MIKINIVRDMGGFIREFTVKGHAGFKKSGSDIICAGVSAIVYTALGALDEMLAIRNYTEKDGYIQNSIPIGISEQEKHTAGIILDSMVIGLKQMEIAYEKYITLVDEEV